MPDSRLDPQEVHAALGARQQLGHEFDSAVADSFVDRVSEAIDARIDARLAGQGGSRDPASSHNDRTPMIVALVSLGTGIPITAIAGGLGGVSGILITWIGIAAVNVAYGWRRR
jgi:hypothetical protein